MENLWVLIVTSLLSGVIATIITIFVQKRSESIKEKRQIFSTLMSHRYLISDEENVEALNKIDVVFYKQKRVRQAWKDFMECADKGASDPAINIIDKYLKLLEIMADAVGYKNISWDEIKKAYYPISLSEKIVEEKTLRKIQLQQAQQDFNQDRSNNNAMSTQELGMQVILKALDSPNGFQSLERLMELVNKQNKNGK